MITNLLSEEIAKKFKLNANFDDEEFKRLARKENLKFSGDMPKTVRRIRDAVHIHNDDTFKTNYMGIKVILDDPVNIKSNLLERLKIAKEQNDEENIKKAEERIILKDYFTKVAKLEGKAVREVLEEKTKLKLEKEAEPISEEPKQAEEQQKPKIEEPKKEEPKQINKDVFNEEDIQKYNLKPNISDEERAQILENDIKEFNRASTMTPERKEFLKWEIQRLLMECWTTIGEDRTYILKERFKRIAKKKYNEEIKFSRKEIRKMELLSSFEEDNLKINNDFDLDLLREIRVIENFEKGLGKEVKIIEKIPQKTILMLPAPNQERTAQKIESINNCKQIIEDCFKEIRELPIENQNIDPDDWRIIRAINLEKKPLEQIPEIIEIFRNACNSENIEEQNKIFDQLLKIFEDHYEKIRQPFSKKLRIFKRAFLKMLRILEISKSNRICLKEHIFIDTSKIQNNACFTNTQEVLKEKTQKTEIEENKGFKTSLQVINNITRIQENPKQPDKIKHTFKLLRTLRKENKNVAKTMKKTLRYILREATRKRILEGV